MCKSCYKLKPGKIVQGQWYCYECLTWDATEKSYVLPDNKKYNNKTTYLARYDECKTCKHCINNICTTKSNYCVYEENVTSSKDNKGDKCDICQTPFPSEQIEKRVYHSKKGEEFEVYTCDECDEFMKSTEPNHE
jgi:hypothetical protein